MLHVCYSYTALSLIHLREYHTHIFKAFRIGNIYENLKKKMEIQQFKNILIVV